MGKLLWGSSLSEMTGCFQYVPVAILSRYTDTEMIYAMVTKAVNVELLSLSSTVKSARPKVCRWVGMDLKPNRSFAPVGWGMKRCVCSAFAGTRTSAESGARTYTLRRGWMWEGEMLQSKSSFSRSSVLLSAIQAEQQEGEVWLSLESSHRAVGKVFSYLPGGILLHESRKCLHFLWKMGCNRPGKWCVKRLG